MKHRIYGMPDERKRRWCGPCGQKRGGILITKQSCEDCDAKKATYGLASEGKPRWCAGCRTNHAGVVPFLQVRRPLYCAPSARRGASRGGRRAVQVRVLPEGGDVRLSGRQAPLVRRLREESHWRPQPGTASPRAAASPSARPGL